MSKIMSLIIIEVYKYIYKFKFHKIYETFMKKAKSNIGGLCGFLCQFYTINKF